MEQTQLVVRFVGATKDDANRFARSLADGLSEIEGIGSAKPQRDDEQAQDFGATLVLILGTASVTAIAQGIKTWLNRHGTDVEIDRTNGKTIIRNVASKDIADIAKAISPEKP